MADKQNFIAIFSSAVVAIAVSAGGIYKVAIEPLVIRTAKLEDQRDKDRQQLGDMYVAIRANDADKRTSAEIDAALRRDLEKIALVVDGIQKEQQSRTTRVASTESLQRQIDNLRKRHEDLDHKASSSYTLNDELKNLRSELESLRKSVMVPLAAPR